MKKLLLLLFVLFAIGTGAQTVQSITGTWTLSKVVKIDRMNAAELKKGKEMLEDNVILTFNEDGSFKSTATKAKEPKTWLYQKKKKTILIKGKKENLKIQILSYNSKAGKMRVKMNLSKSVLGEFVLLKN
ncbi:hypothetical protein [Flavobacterium sp.]|uniref:hypothetical protein n=1 Tax=Flavobacterium sp. TaxID=239 RepID=UPI0039E34FBB